MPSPQGKRPPVLRFLALALTNVSHVSHNRAPPLPTDFEILIISLFQDGKGSLKYLKPLNAQKSVLGRFVYEWRRYSAAAALPESGLLPMSTEVPY